MGEDVIGSLSEDTMTFGAPWAQYQPAVSNAVFRFFHKRLCFYDEADMFGLTDLSGFVIGDQVEGDLLPFDDGDGGFGADGAADEVGCLWARPMKPPTVVSPSERPSFTASQAASSMRAERTGVARTGSEPLLPLSRYHFL